jgi:hypothetical protein
MSGIAQAASGALALRPPTWRVGAHGIEVEWALPGLMRLLVAGVGGLALLVGGLTELLYRLDELPFSLFGFLLDPWTLVLLVPLVLALLVFDARSNERCVFGATEVVHETRVGRFVVARQVTPLAAIENIETIEAQPAQDGFAVGWRVRGAPLPFRLGGALPREQAEALASALRAWIAAPGRALPERAAEVAHEVPRLLLRALAARAAGAIPFAMGAFGLLAAATLWNLRAAGGLEDAAFDAQAPGELVRYRFIATLPADAAARDWLAVDVHAEIGVRWRDAGDEERMLWLRAPDAIPQYSFIDQRVEGLVQHLALPHIEWSLPAEAAPLFDPAAPAFADLPARAAKEHARHHEWVQGLDLPIEYATALAIAAASDWQVAYASEDPGRAQLAVLARIIEDGQRALPPWVAWLFIAGTALPGALFLFSGLGGGRLAFVAALACLLGLPLWAPHANPLAQRLGVAPAASTVARDALSMGMPPAAQDAAMLLQPIAAPTERPGEVVVRWTPAGSGTAPLLGPFGLDTVAARPGAAFADTRDQLIAGSAQRIAALDDAALVELVRIIEADRSRYHALNAARVRGLCLARAQAERSENTRRWIDHGLGSPAMCNSG